MVERSLQRGVCPPRAMERGCVGNVERGMSDRRANLPGAEKPCDCSAWKKRLQIIDFALLELVLYLDAYPDCREALAYYQALCEERRLLLSAMPEKGDCRMTNLQTCAEDGWTWTKGPWPWQVEANE